MKCVICKQGDTRPGTVTVTLERGGTTLVFKNVPAQVCENCGEAYVDEATTEQLLTTAEAAVKAGVQVEVREFVYLIPPEPAVLLPLSGAERGGDSECSEQG